MEQQKFSPAMLGATSVVALAGCIVLLSLAMRISGRTGPLAASLDLAEDFCDLGQTSNLQEWRVPFRIGNAGTRRLVINEVHACCGPGNSGRQTLIIRPGETADVIVSLDTRGTSGQLEKIASFTSSDPAHPRFDLTVRAWVDVDETASGSEVDQQNRKSVLIGQKQ